MNTFITRPSLTQEIQHRDRHSIIVTQTHIHTFLQSYSSIIRLVKKEKQLKLLLVIISD